MLWEIIIGALGYGVYALAIAAVLGLLLLSLSNYLD